MTAFRDDLADVDEDFFDGLDEFAGAAGAYARLRQHERDGRLRSRYLDLGPAGVVPCHRARGQAWHDPAYDPGTWPLPGGAELLGADRAVLVGGCADRRSALHLAAGERRASVAAEAVAAIAADAAAEGCGLVFAYLGEADRAAVDAATGGRTEWAPLGREAWFDPAERPGSRVGNVLRRDRRAFERTGLRTSYRTWDGAEEGPCASIAAHNERFGVPDHLLFVQARYATWAECPGVRPLLFTAAAGAAAGVLTAIVWRNRLELLEVGLTEEDGPERLAVYLSLIAHQPLAYAAEHGLASIRAGLEAERPKGSRGASFRPLYGGILGVAETQAVAA